MASNCSSKAGISTIWCASPNSSLNGSSASKRFFVATLSSAARGKTRIFKAKGFEDAIVSTSSSNINVIVKSAELQESEVAQIVEIIQGQTNYNLDNIKIIPVE